jgi:hypothetical protein
VKEPATGTLADREGHRITSNLIEPLNVSTPNFFNLLCAGTPGKVAIFRNYGKTLSKNQDE